jgi:hypothetical protein
MMVWLNAWPMCRVPVTLGGGSWMETGLLRVGGGGEVTALFPFLAPEFSISAGSNDLANSMI